MKFYADLDEDLTVEEQKAEDKYMEELISCFWCKEEMPRYELDTHSCADPIPKEKQ
jgi:hypothetical protein